jgi:pyroglutamyl-peptidase
MSAAGQTLLLTGFEPFGGDRRNPSGETALALDGYRLSGDAVIRSLVLPVSAGPAWELARKHIRILRPRWIVATGVGPRDRITPEEQAVNWCDYRIPDNAGVVRREVPAVPGGRKAFRCGPDVQALADAVLAAGVPAGVSDDAGRFVCNDFYCRLLRLTSRRGHAASGRSLFVHVPRTPEMGGAPPFMDLAAIRAGLLALLDSLVTQRGP